MNIASGKISNYIGQIKDKLNPIDKMDTYLVSVEKDLTNLWLIVTAMAPAVTSATKSLSAIATTNYTYIPLVTSSPSGVPTVYVGKVPICYSSSDNKIYVYYSAWKSTTALAWK